MQFWFFVPLRWICELDQSALWMNHSNLLNEADQPKITNSEEQFVRRSGNAATLMNTYEEVKES